MCLRKFKVVVDAHGANNRKSFHKVIEATDEEWANVVDGWT